MQKYITLNCSFIETLQHNIVSSQMSAVLMINFFQANKQAYMAYKSRLNIKLKFIE